MLFDLNIKISTQSLQYQRSHIAKIMKKTLLLLSLLAMSAAEAADVPSETQNQPAPELQVKTAEPDPVEEAAVKPAAETSSEKVVNVDAKTCRFTNNGRDTIKTWRSTHADWLPKTTAK